MSELVRRISRGVEEDTGRLDNCEAVSDIIDDETGGVLGYMQGVRIVGGEAVAHAWNVDTRDGTIIDATSNQFGGERVRVVPLYAHEQQEYRHAERYAAHRPINPRTNNFFIPESLCAWDADGHPRFAPLW